MTRISIMLSLVLCLAAPVASARAQDLGMAEQQVLALDQGWADYVVKQNVG